MSGLICKCHTNLRNLPGTNTLAYFALSSVTKGKKSFITPTLGRLFNNNNHTKIRASLQSPNPQQQQRQRRQQLQRRPQRLRRRPPLQQQRRQQQFDLFTRNPRSSHQCRIRYPLAKKAYASWCKRY
jgi:hypothetical protein